MSRISVLVADDNRPVRDLLTSTLAEHFRMLAAVSDGRALVEAALRRRPDVIVSDVSMPVLDGIGAMRLLQALGVAVPVVMVSADCAAGPECLAAGAVEFVCKEHVTRDLATAVRRAASRTSERSLHPGEPQPLPADADRAEVRARPNE